jgi:hypothetical protein
LVVRLGVVALVIALAVTGCAGHGGSPTEVAQTQAAPDDTYSPEPAPSSAAAPTSRAPRGKGVLGASPSATRKSSAPARPAATPSRRPVTIAGPPPPAPKPAPLPSDRPCPYHEGTDASRSSVKSALVAAGSTHFWSTADITVPSNLMKAVAWQESGWQSTIIACDGGIGTMQIMPATADWMNQRFGASYDEHTLTGNTKIGAALLEWLIKYFGDVYFEGDYTLDPAACADETSPCLLNAIIASYNYGFGAVDTDKGIVIPNPQYVRNVRALMTECECLSF